MLACAVFAWDKRRTMNILTNPGSSVRTYLPAPGQIGWQTELRTAIRDPLVLCRLLELPAQWAERAQAGGSKFPLFVPSSYLRRMERGNPEDPLLRQVLPVAEESGEAVGYDEDPVGDRAAICAAGLLHKYAGRALLVLTGACAVHCRYCFRRHFPYAQLPQAESAWDRPLAALAADDSIQEVILSGGDPLMWVDRRLATLARRISAIGHIRRLRVHTRLPVMIPGRVTDTLVDWLAGGRLTPVVVVHANHARELSEDVAAAMARLHRAGVMLLNQAVLLRRVNDTVAAQVSLSERLVQLRVVPYYLHQLDRVRGAAHFEVPVERGQEIVAALRRQLPGYAVPRYVREVAGEPYKVSLGG
jgi:EF-P beta-lysylation protein EpmB